MPRTFCNHVAAAITRIKVLLGWLFTTSYDFDTASTGIQETESLRTKAAKATYASALTKGVYVLYGLLETKTPQQHFLHSADDKVSAAGVDKSLVSPKC